MKNNNYSLNELKICGSILLAGGIFFERLNPYIKDKKKHKELVKEYQKINQKIIKCLNKEELIIIKDRNV